MNHMTGLTGSDFCVIFCLEFPQYQATHFPVLFGSILQSIAMFHTTKAMVIGDDISVA